jgi:hypothetical protein
MPELGGDDLFTPITKDDDLINRIVRGETTLDDDEITRTLVTWRHEVQAEPFQPTRHGTSDADLVAHAMQNMTRVSSDLAFIVCVATSIGVVVLAALLLIMV